MGNDWIRMRSDLYRDPKVCAIADVLSSGDSKLSRYVNQNCQRDITVTRNVMRNAVVGALVSVWGVLRHRGKCVGEDLLLPICDIDAIDDVADLPGFGEAMVAVGWARKTSKGLVLPRFFAEYNADPSGDYLAKNRERQKRFRDKQRNGNRNVTVTPKRNARVEKSREEKNINTGGRAGVFVNVTLSTLQETKSLLGWYESAVAAKAIPRSEATKIAIVGMAERCLEKASNPAAMFVSLVRSQDWGKISGEQDQRAVQRLRDYERATGPPENGRSESSKMLADAFTSKE